MDGIVSDLRLTLRGWRQSPGFALVALLSLAIGMGATTTVFTLVDRVLLRALPVVRPHELVQVTRSGDRFGSNRGDGSELSYPMYVDLANHQTVFAGMFCRVSFPFHLGIGGRSERVAGEIVSGSYFATLGINAAIGRTLLPEDDMTPGGHPVAVLSHAFWRSRFNGDASVLGQTMTANGHTLSIVGVAEPGFDGIELGRPAHIFVPMMMSAAMMSNQIRLDDRRYDWVRVIGRLKPGVTIEQATSALQPFYRSRLEMEVTEPSFAITTADGRRKFLASRLEILPSAQGSGGFRRRLATPLWVLMAIAGGVLLIACANVANLLLARAADRQKELALRLALGAGRGRLVRQLVVESLALSMGGAIAGVAIGLAGAPLLVSYFATADVPQPVSTLPDVRIVAVSALIALMTGLTFGLAPALQSTKASLAPILKAYAAAVIGGHARLRRGFVVAQIALSLLLVSGAALFLQTVDNLLAANVGFDVERLISLSIDPSLNGYPAERNKQFATTLLDRLRALPGVTGAGLASVPLLQGDQWTSGMRIEGIAVQQDRDMTQFNKAVSPGYFQTMGIPLVAGRDFDLRDERSGPAAPGRQYRAAIVNERFAREYFGNESPLGRHVAFGFNPSIPIAIEIVGVVKDAKYLNVRNDAPRQVFVPYLEQTRPSDFTVYIRTTGEPEAVFQSVRRAVQQLDADLPLYNMRTLDVKVQDSLRGERFTAAMSTLFGALATALAMLGIYGVMAHSVGRRRREIGIRMALGARAGTVAWLITREALSMAAVGVAIGLPLTIWMGRLATRQLYGVAPTDPATLAGASVAIVVIASAAALVPSRRAASIDPSRMLQIE